MCWRSGSARREGGAISEISGDLFSEVINYLPAGSHDVYVTAADGLQARLAAVQIPEDQFVLIFAVPQGATSSLKLTWPGNSQMDISGLVQVGTSPAPAAVGQATQAQKPSATPRPPTAVASAAPAQKPAAAPPTAAPVRNTPTAAPIRQGPAAAPTLAPTRQAPTAVATLASNAGSPQPTARRYSGGPTKRQ